MSEPVCLTTQHFTNADALAAAFLQELGSADLEEDWIVVDFILHAQHCKIGPQCHLACAVGVEVKLVLYKVRKMFVDRKEALERLQKTFLNVVISKCMML